MPDKKFDEFLSEHLPYEIDMFRAAFMCLSIGVFTGALRNALIESYAIHARNLLEFFCRDGNAWPIDEFCDTAYIPMKTPKKLFTKISSQVAHLGKNRTVKGEAKLNASDPKLVEVIEREIERFSRHLKEEFQHLLKVSSAPIRFGSVAE